MKLSEHFHLPIKLGHKGIYEANGYNVFYTPRKNAEAAVRALNKYDELVSCLVMVLQAHEKEGILNPAEKHKIVEALHGCDG